MIIAVPKETTAGERRVALTPDVVKRVAKGAVQIKVESGAGVEAGFDDAQYEQVGAGIARDAAQLWREADVVLKVQRPGTDGGRNELDWLKAGGIVVGMLQPLVEHDLVREFAKRRITSFSLDQLPRITRAQSMDILSSMSTVAGYKAVLLAAAELDKFFPMLVTAAGTVAPAKVLVLGAGVAGLQAIATARRLGAVVEAFDVRPEVKEQVESLGAKFLAAEAVEASGEGGYAKELSDEQHKRELELLHEHVKQVDVVVTTALILGRPAPELITEAMVRDMRSGSVIVDLAAEAGGNCALTEKGETVQRHGVRILGPLHVAATVPFHASQMFARNMAAFLGLLIKDSQVNLDFEDEIIRGTCITHEGRVVNERVKPLVEGGND